MGSQTYLHYGALNCVLPHIPLLHSPDVMFHRPKATGPQGPDGQKLLFVTVAES